MNLESFEYFIDALAANQSGNAWNELQLEYQKLLDQPDLLLDLMVTAVERNINNQRAALVITMLRTQIIRLSMRCFLFQTISHRDAIIRVLRVLEQKPSIPGIADVLAAYTIWTISQKQQFTEMGDFLMKSLQMTLEHAQLSLSIMAQLCVLKIKSLTQFVPLDYFSILLQALNTPQLQVNAVSLVASVLTANKTEDIGASAVVELQRKCVEIMLSTLHELARSAGGEDEQKAAKRFSQVIESMERMCGKVRLQRAEMQHMFEILTEVLGSPFDREIKAQLVELIIRVMQGATRADIDLIFRLDCEVLMRHMVMQQSQEEWERAADTEAVSDNLVDALVSCFEAQVELFGIELYGQLFSQGRRQQEACLMVLYHCCEYVGGALELGFIFELTRYIFECYQSSSAVVRYWAVCLLQEMVFHLPEKCLHTQEQYRDVLPFSIEACADPVSRVAFRATSALVNVVTSLDNLQVQQYTMQLISVSRHLLESPGYIPRGNALALLSCLTESLSRTEVQGLFGTVFEQVFSYYDLGLARLRENALANNLTTEEQAFLGRLVECASFTVPCAYEFAARRRDAYLDGLFEYIALGVAQKLDHIVRLAIVSLRKAARQFSFERHLGRLEQLLRMFAELQKPEAQDNILSGHVPTPDKEHQIYLGEFLENLPQIMERQGATLLGVREPLIQFLLEIEPPTDDARGNRFDCACSLACLESEASAMNSCIVDRITALSSELLSMPAATMQFFPLYVAKPIKLYAGALASTIRAGDAEFKQQLRQCLNSLLQLLRNFQGCMIQNMSIALLYIRDQRERDYIGDQECAAQVSSLLSYAENYSRHMALAFEQITRAVGDLPGGNALCVELFAREFDALAAGASSSDFIAQLLFGVAVGMLSSVSCYCKLDADLAECVLRTVQECAAFEPERMKDALKDAVADLCISWTQKLKTNDADLGNFLEVAEPLRRMFLDNVQTNQTMSVRDKVDRLRLQMALLQLEYHGEELALRRLDLSQLTTCAEVELLLLTMQAVAPQLVAEMLIPHIFHKQTTWLIRTIEPESILIIAQHVNECTDPEIRNTVQWWLSGFNL